MSEPQFIPSSIPHSVEMTEGSHVAKSRSGQAGTEVRRTEQDRFAQDQEIEVEAHQVIMATTAAASENKIKLPPRDNIERASKPLRASSMSESASRMKSAPSVSGDANQRTVYDTEMPEMNFPARLIHLKLENDAVRSQLESLQSLLQKDNT
jgi:hypothetical protein